LRFGIPIRDRHTLKRVGYVHESQAFPSYLTARTLLEYYGALSAVPRAEVRRRAGELLDYVGLSDRLHEPIGGFSKGMLQRLALAQALINDPELLVLDEPTEGMDLFARHLLHGLVLERKRRGKTAILVSHSLSDVEQLCDHAVVLRSGEVAFAGALDDLTHPGHDTQESALPLEDALQPLYAGATA
jgi:ABC-2 type transport system ATP-binding protein